MKDYGKYFNVPSLKDAKKRKPDAKELQFTMDDRNLNIGAGKKYLIQTYGCQGNEADSEMMSGIFEQMGFVLADSQEDADIILLNTCAVRDNAENRVYGEMGRLSKYKRTNPDLILGVCGCMAQEENVIEKLLTKYPYIDLIFGTHNIYKLPEYLYQAYMEKERVVEVFSDVGSIVEGLPKVRESKHKAWINIMYGCDEFCTYCIVPMTRGKERSRQPLNIIEEVKELVENGYKEVTLLGQNVNAYGKDLELNDGFANLLRELDKTGIERIRYTTSHPRDLDEATIKAMAECDSVMEHLHLPVQSGSNQVLKKMNRHYTKEEYITLIKMLRSYIPDIALTTDIIVGFPNETEEDFMETIDLVNEVDFEGAFTFIYSKRDGTPAAKWDDNVDQKEKKDRLNRLMEATNSGYLKGTKRFEGEIVEVLVDGPSKNNPAMMTGYSRHNKLVNFKHENAQVGDIVKVKVTEAKTWFMMGEMI